MELILALSDFSAVHELAIDEASRAREHMATSTWLPTLWSADMAPAFIEGWTRHFLDAGATIDWSVACLGPRQDGPR